MKAIKVVIGIIFEALTLAALAVGVMASAILSILPGLLWIIGDLASGGYVSEWLTEPFKNYCRKLKDSL